MKLADYKVSDFTIELASKSPAPGGGSTAALCGSVGASLIRMVAGLTQGKEKYAQHEELMLELIDKTEIIRADFLDVMDRDTEAFNAVSAVFSMPKATDEDKAARKAAMQAALKACTETPLEMMRLALQALKLLDSALGKINLNAASDMGVAALTLKAATQGAWLNVLINIGGIDDCEFVQKYRKEGEEILSEAMALADKGYEMMLRSL